MGDLAMPLNVSRCIPMKARRNGCYTGNPVLAFAFDMSAKITARQTLRELQERAREWPRQV
jgi:hypothetical protein